VSLSKERIDAFLKQLTELSLRTGVVIGGCGCCGSPFMQSTDKKCVPEVGFYASDEYENIEWQGPDDET